MKHKLLISVIIFLFSYNFINAQSNYYYYYKGEKIYLTLDKSKLNITTSDTFLKTSIDNLNFKDFILQDGGNTQEKFAEIEFQSEPNDSEFFQKINSLKQNPNIENVSLFFKRGNAKPIGTSRFFYVKLNNSADLELLSTTAMQKNVSIVKQVTNMPLWYIITLNHNTIGSSLELSNAFFETGLFADVDPAFMFEFKSHTIYNSNSDCDINPDYISSSVNCTNDPEYSTLWGIENTSNPNIDVNACQAWSIAEGQGTKVAIIDNGILTTISDLAANLLPTSYNAQNGTSPSIYQGGNHGIGTASIVAAIKNNNLNIVGVSPKSKILGVSHVLNITPTFSSELASGISWAWQNGADVLNNSWGDVGGTQYNQIHSTILEDAILNAMTLGRGGKGSIVVFSAGNYAINGPLMEYPGNFNKNILTTGAIDVQGNRSVFSSTQASSYGQELDVVAPGSDIITLVNGGTLPQSGTSMAAPFTAGIASLVLSINPCLSGKQVRDIIERTSQKIGTYSYVNTSGRPNGSWNIEMGYGLVDAYAAVQLAQQMSSATLDLMVKDGTDDFGLEPNNTTPYMWTSTDIWVRTQADGIDEHQNPEFSATIPNHGYVRVVNKSCVASSGNEHLKFYWAKAGTSLEWPNSWDGNHYFPIPNDTKKLGAPIGTVTIPVLQPGQEAVLHIPFLVPNPDDYSFAGSDQWHFCLLARIEASSDLSNEANGLYTNVQNNNNIAWKNITVVDLVENKTSGIIAVGNPFNEPRTFFLELVKENLETGKPIYEEAEVSIKMDEMLFNAWERGGKQAQQLEETLDEKRKIVKGNNVIINNIAFNGKETGILNLNFNFLTKELTEKSKYAYHVVQKDALTGQIIGGETYIIKKHARSIFIADAGGEKEVDKNEPITISASQISEPAIYNWYDSHGNLILQGKDLSISTDIAKKYTLEVIATTDGFKDYTEVEVKMKPSTLDLIYPNPAINTVNVMYKLNEVSASAYLMIIGGYGTTGVSNNYILDIDSTCVDISLSNYPNGFYTVALILNGEIVDAKTLVKN